MTQHLPNQPQTEQAVNVPAFSGAILGLQGDVLHGWAIDNVQPDQRPAVEVFIDGASVALARADQYEPNAPAGDHYNGFSVQLRQHWINGARSITVKIANQSFMLEGQLSLPAAPSEDSASIASQVWHTGGLRIGGWCWDPKAPNRHVKVTVRAEDGRVIRQALCNEHNQALAYRATSDHGFAIDLPWELADGKVHVLEIINDLGKPLVGSPIRLCCWPQGIEGLIRQLSPANNAAVLELLSAVAKEQDLRLPKSVGWSSYAQWFETFQRLDQLESPKMNARLGLLLISEGDSRLEQISLESIGQDLENLHIKTTVTSTNLWPGLQLLIEAKCDRILPIKAGDYLASLALPHICALLDNGDAWGFVDCDRDDSNGERSLPWLKPVWDIDTFIGADIFSPGAIFTAKIVQEALVFLASRADHFSISWDDLIAGIALATEKNKANVAHLPRVLYHRASKRPGSPELAKPSSQRKRAIEWLCDSLSPGATATEVPGYPSLLKANWALPEKLPKVSLIVPTRDQYKLLHACVEGLLNDTDYPELEIIIVDNNSTDPDTLNYLIELRDRGVVVLEHPFPFNYSTINNRAASIAKGELLGLINNDIAVINSDWLKEMVAQICRPGVGAVGAKLMWPNQMVQHGGVVVGINCLAAHTGNHLARTDAGYLGTNQIVRQQTAVTAACLLLKRSVFDAVNGLDENKFPVAFNDVNLCMLIREKGWKVIWTPFAELIHAESASRGKDQTPEKSARAQREQHGFVNRWAAQGFDDPFYHPALSNDYLSGPYGGLALPPRLRARNIKPCRS